MVGDSSVFYAQPTSPAPMLPPIKGNSVPKRILIAFAVLVLGLPGGVTPSAVLAAGPNKKKNEASAIRSIHSIIEAETMYESNYPVNGFACSLAALGGNATSGAPSPAAAQLLPHDLASGVKSGYLFRISSCSKVNVRGTDRITAFTVTAVPQTVGTTGDLGFCSNESGVIKFDPAGGPNCTQTLE